MLFNKTKYLFYLCALAGVCSCHQQGKTSLIDNGGVDRSKLTSVNSRDLVLRAQEGLFYFNNQPFTGLAVKYYADSVLAQEIAYVNGKKEDFLRRWFPNGQLSQESSYKNGRLHGKSSTWWEDGVQRSESHFDNGKPHGLQKQWYRGGAAFKEQNLVHGVEEGMQRAWRKNGKLYVNYEARNGRIFGLKKAGLCYEVEDEMAQYGD